MKQLAKGLCLFVLTVTFFTINLYADPIVIQSGSLELDARSYLLTTPNAGHQLNFNFSGQNFSINGTQFTQDVRYPVIGGRYETGTNLSNPITFSAFEVRGFNITYNGASYPVVLFDRFPNSFTFTPLAPIMVPVIPNGQNVFSMSVPFIANGYFTLQCPPDVANCSSPSQLSFTGQGTATYTFINNSRSFPVPGTWLSNVSYTFSTPEPTPEPATLVLLGTGLLGILGYNRRKKG